jgi:uncharacterized protein YjiS (DUF1127 family)
MAVLELVNARPDWMNALGVALTRPPGVPERRHEEDPWESASEAERPRRISDDLAWLRQAMDEPGENGLDGLDDTAAVGAWIPQADACRRLERLRDRQVLDAAGFLLHEDALTA